MFRSAVGAAALALAVACADPAAAQRVRAGVLTCDISAGMSFIIGSQNEVVDRIGRYGERTGTDHILLRVQWPGLDQKTVLGTLERLGRVVEKLK